MKQHNSAEPADLVHLENNIKEGDTVEVITPSSH